MIFAELFNITSPSTPVFFFFQDSKSEGDSKARKVLGHTFTKEEERGKKLSCDKCGKTIWMWQSLFTCNGTD